MYDYVRNEGRPQESRDPRTAPVAGFALVRLQGGAPLHWLRAGWSDLRACRYRSLVYGLFFVLMGLGIDHAHDGNSTLALGLSAAFLFAGPFLSMGIYELSRQRQAGEAPDLLLSLFSWCRNPAAVGRFAFFLSLVLLLWLWLSSTLMTSLAQGAGISTLMIATLWGMLAFAVLLASALAIPMLLDRPVDAMLAVKTSIHGFGLNPTIMALWYLIVALAVILSLSLHYWPLLILGPWLGHATWHAYQQCLEAVPSVPPDAEEQA